MSDAKERRTVWYHGQVQGVGFRYSARNAARGRPVTGYVKNLPNGDVELVVEGTGIDIAAFLADVSARMQDFIAGTRIEPGTATGEFDAFEIRH